MLISNPSTWYDERGNYIVNKRLYELDESKIQHWKIDGTKDITEQMKDGEKGIIKVGDDKREEDERADEEGNIVDKLNVGIYGMFEVVKDEDGDCTYQDEDGYWYVNIKVIDNFYRKGEIIPKNDAIELLGEKVYSRMGSGEIDENIYERVLEYQELKRRKMKSNEREINLNPLYTFENYIEGESNNVAMQIFMAKYILEKKTNIHTLYLFGDESVGKTHLLQAIAHQALDDNKSVEYISSVQWMNEFTANLRFQTMDKFKNKYQNCDVLLIDDIEFLSGKNQTQEELFHIINERKSNKRKTIISSQYSFIRLKGFSARFKSLFSSGYFIKMYSLELIKKMDIVRTKSKQLEMNLDEGIIEYITISMIGDNLHSVNGILSTLKLYSDVMNKDITLEFVKEVLEYIFEKDEDEKYKDGGIYVKDSTNNSH